MYTSDFLLAGLREASLEILADKDNHSVEAIIMADYFTELDKKMHAGEIPRDWVPF